MCRCHYVSSWGRDSKYWPARSETNHTNGLRPRQHYLFSYWQWSSTQIVKPKLKQRLIWSLAQTASRCSAIVSLYHISKVWCKNPSGSPHRVCSRASLIFIPQMDASRPYWFEGSALCSRIILFINPFQVSRIDQWLTTCTTECLSPRVLLWLQTQGECIHS